MSTLLLLWACEEPEVRAERCTGALNRLVRWRDEMETDLKYGKKKLTHVELALQEKAQVDATVAGLAPHVDCASVWRTQLFQMPDTPSLRLQEESILLLLGETPHEYDSQAVGWAGVTIAGHVPIETKEE